MLTVTIDNGGFEQVVLLDGELVQGRQITVKNTGANPPSKQVLYVNSLVTDDRPDLAICTLIAAQPIVGDELPQVVEPAVEPASVIAPPATPPAVSVSSPPESPVTGA